MQLWQTPTWARTLPWLLPAFLPTGKLAAALCCCPFCLQASLLLPFAAALSACRQVCCCPLLLPFAAALCCCPFCLQASLLLPSAAALCCCPLLPPLVTGRSSTLVRRLQCVSVVHYSMADLYICLVVFFVCCRQLFEALVRLHYLCKLS